MKALFFPNIIFLLSCLATVPVFSQKYEISITLNSHNDTVILGHYYTKGDLRRANDTIVLKNGKGVFKGDKTLANGVYFLINDRRLLFDFLIGDNQQFGIVIDTADLVNRAKFTSSRENDVFFEFQRHKNERVKQQQQLNEQFRSATTDIERNEIRQRLLSMNRELIEYIDNLVEANSNLVVSKFLKTVIPPEARLPEPPRDEQGRITDSLFVYRWYRAHFFDNLNIYDPDMLRTPFYEEKILNYMTRVIPQHPDSINAEADKILSKAKANGNDDIFRILMITLFNHYVQSKIIVHENVWVHIADKWYIPYSTWSTADYIETLKQEVVKKTPNLIGKQAPPIEMLTALSTEHFKAAALDTAIKFDLYAGRVIPDFRRELKSKFTVLYFWDYSCGHCKQSIRKLFNIWEESKDDDFQVITIQTLFGSRNDKGKWIDFVNENELYGWINAWSPYSYKYKELYDISSTPQLFLLDEKGNIMLKKLEPEQIKEFIDTQK